MSSVHNGQSGSTGDEDKLVGVEVGMENVSTKPLVSGDITHRAPACRLTGRTPQEPNRRDSEHVGVGGRATLSSIGSNHSGHRSAGLAESMHQENESMRSQLIALTPRTIPLEDRNRSCHGASGTQERLGDTSVHREVLAWFHARRTLRRSAVALCAATALLALAAVCLRETVSESTQGARSSSDGQDKNAFEIHVYGQPFTKIAAGGMHTVALKNNRSVVAWGANTSGQTDVPKSLAEVRAIAAGYFHSVALKEDGSVVAWGANDYGQATPPTELSNVIAIAAGGFHSIALKADGTVVAWGSNEHGQANVPAGLSGVIAISAGYFHTVALKNDGTVVAWGSNEYGQLSAPEDSTKINAIAAGFFHTVALRNDGSVVAWGSNTNGQSTVPPELSRVAAIAAGGFHTIALRDDGTVVAWGSNDKGQANVPAGTTVITAIAAGGFNSIALTSIP